jgi:uncharacterized protein YdaT
MAAECVGYHSKAGDLKMLGFAILDQGFYNILIPRAGKVMKAACIIQVLQGEASEKKIEEELKNLKNSNWDWDVRQLYLKEYMAIFPDKASLETFLKISEILMSIHGIKVRILKSKMDPDAIEVLQMTWVKIYGLPSIALKEEIVLNVTTLTGDPILVDELSLIKMGPVRVKMFCRDPAKLRGFVRILFNMVGYEIRFISEKYKDKMVFPLSPSDRKDGYEEGSDGDGEDFDDEDSDKKHKRKPEHAHGDKDVLMIESSRGQSTKGGNSSSKQATFSNLVPLDDDMQKGEAVASGEELLSADVVDASL